MDFDTFMRAALALVLVFLLVSAVRAFRLGRIKVSGDVLSRDDDPRRYWRALGAQGIWCAAIALIVAFPFISPGIVLTAIVGGTLVERGLAAHDWRDQRSPSQRRQETSILVFATLALAAAIIAIVWFFFLPS